MTIGIDMFACNTASELANIREERDRYKAALEAIADPSFPEIGLTSHLPYILMKIARDAIGKGNEA